MNILIIHTAFIGDIVLSTALVSKVKEKYPDSNIYYLTTPLGKEILKNNPKIKEIIVYDKRGKDKGFKAFISFIRKIRKLKIDVCLTPHRYLRSSILSLLSGASIRVGYDIASLAFVYNKKIKYDKTKHEVEKLLSLKLTQVFLEKKLKFSILRKTKKKELLNLLQCKVINK